LQIASKKSPKEVEEKETKHATDKKSDVSNHHTEKPQNPNLKTQPIAIQNRTRPSLKDRRKRHGFRRRLAIFLRKNEKDGRICVPRLTVLILQGEKPSLACYLLEISLEPT